MSEIDHSGSGEAPVLGKDIQANFNKFIDNTFRNTIFDKQRPSVHHQSGDVTDLDTMSREDLEQQSGEGGSLEEGEVSSDEVISRLETQARDLQVRNIQDSRIRLEAQQQLKAAAAEELAKNYALKLDVVKQIEDYEVARRIYYDQKRESNAMYWMAFTLIMKRAKSENTRYLDFFARKLAAENTYVRCILEMKEESEKLKPHEGHKSNMETAFGAAKKNLLDDLLGVQELVAEKVHSFGKVIESEIIPNLENMVTKFNGSMDEILNDGEAFLEEMELAEANVQQAYNEYREQADIVEKTGVVEQDLWIFEMRYRVSVAVLGETWATCSKGVGNLFTLMKQTEMTRRQAIHSSLQTLHDQQIQYWKKLPELGQTLSTLVQSRVADPQLIEKEIGSDIRAGAQKLEHSEEGRRKKAQIQAHRPTRTFSPGPSSMASAAMSGTLPLTSTLGSTTTSVSPLTLPEAVGPTAVGDDGSVSPPPPPEAGGGGTATSKPTKKRPPREFGLTLAGPLQSPLTCRVQVLTRKSTNVFKPPKPVIAILTVDHYLHLFDVPSHKTITYSSTPDEAFDALIPRPDCVNKSSGKPISPRTMVSREKEANKNVLSSLSPSFSLNLTHCEAHLKSAANVKEMCFEVNEVITTTGIKKVFKDLSHRGKVTLRAASKEDMVEWCQIIQNLSTVPPRNK